MSVSHDGINLGVLKAEEREGLAFFWNPSLMFAMRVRDE